LGCFFAPLLVYFAVSGLWQMAGAKSLALALLSSIHTGRGLKLGNPSTLSSPALRWFAAVMALSLVLNIALGVVMAFRFGQRRAALWSLFAGAATPAAVVVVTLWRAAAALP
jgi:hypothetical protein